MHRYRSDRKRFLVRYKGSTKGAGGGRRVVVAKYFLTCSFMFFIKHLITKGFLFMKFGLQTLRGALRHRGRPRWCWLVFLNFNKISPEFHENFTELAAPSAKSRPYGRGTTVPPADPLLATLAQKIS